MPVIEDLIHHSLLSDLSEQFYFVTHALVFGQQRIIGHLQPQASAFMYGDLREPLRQLL